MFFEMIRAEGLAHQSYLVGGDGVAAVIDPRRDCAVYLERASHHEAAITDIFETHRNEDFVIGSTALASRTGARIRHGSATEFQYGTPVRGGDRFRIGPVELEAIETPGHTQESLSYVLYERSNAGEPLMVFTGDALFAGSVGRTDLASDDRAANAAALYASLHEKLLTLPEGTVVCPAHGAGSVCGISIRDLPLTTIGYEHATNPFLAMDRSTFVRRKAEELTYRPPYFSRMEALNLAGPPSLPGRTLLEPVGLSRLADAQVVDIRSPTAFGAGHIPGSLCIWREGLASFMGWFLGYDEPIVLVDDFNLSLDGVAAQFLRLGYDNLAGYLGGGFLAWFRSGRRIGQIETWSVHELHERLDDVFVLDVRDGNNRADQGAIPGSHHVYVGELESALDALPRDRTIATHCDVGYKGAIAASLLGRHRFDRLANVLGGFSAWKEAGYPIER
jgi:hydroxyacylglutathione hydrolase